MVRRSRDIPAWRAFGAALGALSIAVQLLLSGVLIGHIAAAEDDAGWVICAHDRSATADEGAGGSLPAPAPHDQCPACACPQSAHLFAPPPATLSFVRLLPRSETLQPYHDPVRHDLRVHSPYSSRAPPFSA
jgi:hypothetical protein